ncbi:MAG: adenosylmethionine-8-amino-7-oxononanoate aminotransferase [Candidatus Paceibacteria bacterium]|jgi:adenosylmethionine-8-amino-7-oxononanoate aminotransferase
MVICHSRVLETIKLRLDKVALVHMGFFTSEPAQQLVETLAHQAPGDLNRCFFASGGS